MVGTVEMYRGTPDAVRTLFEHHANSLISYGTMLTIGKLGSEVGNRLGMGNKLMLTYEITHCRIGGSLADSFPTLLHSPLAHPPQNKGIPG